MFKRFLIGLMVSVAILVEAAVGDAVVTFKPTLQVAQTNLSLVVSNLTTYGDYLNTNQFTANKATIKSGALLTNVQFYSSNTFNGDVGIVSSGNTLLNVGTAANKTYIYWNNTFGYSDFGSSGDTWPLRFLINGTAYAQIHTNNFNINVPLAFGALGSPDTFLVREAANSLALRNGTNAQSLYIYNTYNNASDYERFNIGWGGDTLVLRSQAVGSGSQRQVVMDGSALYFQITALARWVIDSSKLYPYADGAYDIGSSANNVKTLYVSNIVAKGSVTMNALTVTNTVNVIGTNYINELVITNGVTIGGFRKTTWGALPIVSGGTTNLGVNHSTYLVVTNNSVITLPTAIGISGRAYTIKAINPATTVTITNATGAQTIDGALAYSLTASNKHVTVQSDNSHWWIIGGN